MTGKQSAVLWLGLGLIIVRLFTTGQWSAAWNIFGTKGSPAESLQLSPQIEGLSGLAGVVNQQNQVVQAGASRTKQQQTIVAHLPGNGGVG